MEKFMSGTLMFMAIVIAGVLIKELSFSEKGTDAMMYGLFLGMITSGLAVVFYKI